EDDGFLTMGEVMNMKLGAEIAVLSACKTGLGETVSGEGIMGMGRAFQYAGAKSVLMSLWSVEAASTNMMTEKFFEVLKQGKSNSEALKEARAYIRSQGYEHPFFWAPFILVGD
ncbi:MAG: CHAT domain-containing protein, partial [Candidatus Margulisbacteria bacterium]|nr:CHAT domain-containing protein [Candidatus Margulisiibacteriota bacterium]